MFCFWFFMLTCLITVCLCVQLDVCVCGSWEQPCGVLDNDVDVVCYPSEFRRCTGAILWITVIEVPHRISAIETVLTKGHRKISVL
uniref:Putative secreted protein n=1 Tax=Ixodes ricinus TaxID=34613 RepID=A0A6B0UAQ7_IXORI